MRSSLISFLPHFAKKWAKKALCMFKEPHKIGRYTILLPGDSLVAASKSACGLYDTALEDIAVLFEPSIPICMRSTSALTWATLPP